VRFEELSLISPVVAATPTPDKSESTFSVSTNRTPDKHRRDSHYSLLTERLAAQEIPSDVGVKYFVVGGAFLRPDKVKRKDKQTSAESTTRKNVRALHTKERLSERVCLSGYIVGSGHTVSDLLGTLGVILAKLGIPQNRYQIGPFSHEDNACGITILASSDEGHKFSIGKGGLLHPVIVTRLLGPQQAKGAAVVWWELWLNSIKEVLPFHDWRFNFLG